MESIINEAILKHKFDQVLLIDEKGTKRGIMTPNEALEHARDAGHDLMIVSVRFIGDKVSVFSS